MVAMRICCVVELIMYSTQLAGRNRTYLKEGRDLCGSKCCHRPSESSFDYDCRQEYEVSEAARGLR